MPLDFVEVEKAKPVEFFASNARTRPQGLEGEVIPELIRRVGDIKSDRLALWMVQQYLERNVLIFDPAVLKELFGEADFKQEGSLDARSLAAAVSGRYPKRKLTKEWRQLVALLLGIPELVLTEDFVNPKVAVNGVFNSESIWSEEPPPLPAVTGRKLRVKAAEAKQQDFQKPVTGATSASLTGTATSVASSLAPFYGDIRVPPPPLVVLTTSGLKSAAPSAAEQAINGGDDAPCSTFTGVSTFNAFTQGQRVMAGQCLDMATASAMAATLGPSTSASPYFATTSTSSASASADSAWAWSSSPKPGLRAWSAALPPAGISLSASALQTLRSSVRSTVNVKPEFTATARSLTTSEVDLKKTMGAPLEMAQSLSRVGPTRPTSMRFDADYLQWGDYASKCRTAPSAWFNEHPSLPEAAKQPTKFPWGEWGVGA